MSNSRKVVVILSGGMDSSTLLHKLVAEGDDVVAAVSFNYGQRHKKELDFAKLQAAKFGIEHIIIDLWSSGFTDAIASSGSSLVSDTDVPEGHYAEENMKATVVPNRNMVMLSIAGSIAVAKGANQIATGVHAGDHAIYPDCRPQFIEFCSETLMLANRGFGSLDRFPIVAPFLYETKANIAIQALKLNVDLSETWSCYKGGEFHCGKCGTCVERLEAIEEAVLNYDPNYFETTGSTGHYDNTVYEDATFWKRALESDPRG